MEVLALEHDVWYTATLLQLSRPGWVIVSAPQLGVQMSRVSQHCLNHDETDLKMAEIMAERVTSMQKPPVAEADGANREGGLHEPGT